MLDTSKLNTIQESIIMLLEDYVDTSKLTQQFWDDFFVYQNSLLRIEGERIFGVLKTYIEPAAYEKVNTIVKEEFKEYAPTFIEVDKLPYNPREAV